MNEKPVVMISSTAHDLPEYRAQVRDACIRVGMFPKMMEHLPALDADAVGASLDHLVDEADVYVGVFAHRYGHIPDGADISITQMEYERAIERDLPRLIFLMHEDVPVLPKNYDKGDAAEKLDRLKERLRKERAVAFFKNPEDLRGLVVDSLNEIKKEMDAARTDASGRPTGAALAESLHYVSEIPNPPEAYIAHPYTLLQVRKLVGRKEELELLTDWVTGKGPLRDVRVFNVVAIGGMGKSALTWTWFNDVAPQEMAPLAGRLWWSFYESDATFENFVTRALAYVSRRPLDEVKKLSFPEREDLLIRILDQEPFLFVLDGLERILIAYARQDAAYLRDEDTIDEKTANWVAGAIGLPHSAGQSFVGKHKLRKAADFRVGRFLRELAGVQASRILISTRLYPADLQAPLGDPIPGCFALFLAGLNDQDALALWRAYNAKGSREAMLPVFHTFDKHPLLIQLLAYEVAEFRDAPGDFDAWKAASPNFNPFGLDLANVQSHVLAHAMRGLSAAELRTLYVIAGFRMPASMNTLEALLVRTGTEEELGQKPFATLGDLDAALAALEDRGLLGWDRRANRYDLHPIVRGVVWTGLEDDTRTALYGALRSHFEAMPMIENYQEIETIDQLSPAIELYNTLIGLQLFDDAFKVYSNWIADATLYRLSASRLQVKLLQGLFPDGLVAPPRLSRLQDRGFTLNALAIAYSRSGELREAVSLLQFANQMHVREDQSGHSVRLVNLAQVHQNSGSLLAAETSVRTALLINRQLGDRFRECAALVVLGLVLASRGAPIEALTALRRSLRIQQVHASAQMKGVVMAFLGELALWQGDRTAAKQLADQAWKLGSVRRIERDLIGAARLQGTAALHLGDFAAAGAHLHYALARARAVFHVEEELHVLLALAEWHRQQDEAAQARVTLDDVWEGAEQGPYRLFQTDTLNVLAQIEQDAGNTAAAIEAAAQAYRLAWCDGPPFAYHWGLEKAKEHLSALGAPEPEMPLFDESEHEPMPEVEINPPDEFGGDEDPDWDDLFGGEE